MTARTLVGLIDESTGRFRDDDMLLEQVSVAERVGT